MVSGETIAAIATAPGRGGVAVVRVSGPEALAIGERLSGRPVEVGRAVFRRLSAATGGGGRQPALLDEAIVLGFRAPHSYTGEDVVEFHCHGGSVTPRRVLGACFSAGARLARRGEFTQRAFLNGKLDYEQAEAVLELIDAKTERAADAALRGLAGSKRRALGALYESALDLSTQLEYALDVDEGELPADFLPSVGGRLASLRSQLQAFLRRLNEGRLLREGALVVLAGPPNAGKSSLMNALLETDRAIVSDAPGTTRDSIEECLDLDGWPIRLVDTAGLREAADAVEAEGVRRTGDLVAKADLVLLLDPPSPSLSDPPPAAVLLVHSKCDLGRGEGLNVSAKTGEGLDELKGAIVAKLGERTESADFSGDALDTAPLRESLALLSSLAPSAASRLPPDIAANVARTVAENLAPLVGATYSSDLLDNLFSRFCVGK